MLHVPDQRIEPIDQVQGPFGSELDVDRAEVAIGRLQQRLDRIGGKARPVFADLILQHPLKADAVVEQVIALYVVGKVAAGDQLAAAGGPPLLGQKFLQVAMLVGIVGLSAEGGAEVIGSARGVGHEVLPPAVDVMSPRVGEVVIDKDLEFSGAGLEAEQAGVVNPLRAEGGFDLREVENALVEVRCSARVPSEGVDGMVRIGRIEARQDRSRACRRGRRRRCP